MHSMTARKICIVLLIVVTAGPLWTAGVSAANPPANVEEALAAGYQRLVVRVGFSDQTVLAEITRWVEPWEVDLTDGWLIVDVGVDGYQKLLDLGLERRGGFLVGRDPDPELPVLPHGRGDPGHRRGVGRRPSHSRQLD